MDTETAQIPIAHFELARRVDDSNPTAEIRLFREGVITPFADVTFYEFTEEGELPVPSEDEDGIHLVYREELRPSVLAFLAEPGTKRVCTRSGERFKALLDTPWTQPITPEEERALEHWEVRGEGCRKESEHPDGMLVRAWDVHVSLRSPTYPRECQYRECPGVGIRSEGEHAHVLMGFSPHERPICSFCPPCLYVLGIPKIQIELSLERFPSVLRAALKPDFRVLYKSTKRRQSARLTYGRDDDWVLEVSGCAGGSRETCVEREERYTR